METNRPNQDPNTGIHYGVISMHAVTQAWSDESEALYGPNTCPKCGNEIFESNNDEVEEEYFCDRCRQGFDAEDVQAEEPQGYQIDTEELKAVDCLDSDIMIIKSPFYTFARQCSPCCPNAGDLGSPDGSLKTYCFNHDFFDNGIAPYKVYSVKTDLEIIPEKASATV